MLDIVYNESVQPEHQLEIDKYVQKVKWLIPGWCRKVKIGVEDAPKTAVLAEVTTIPDYRYADVVIFTNWFNRKDSVKIQSIIHEFIHINTSPVSQFATEGLERFEDDNEMVVAVVVDELNSKDEQATEDLAMAIYDQFYRKEFEPDSQ